MIKKFCTFYTQSPKDSEFVGSVLGLSGTPSTAQRLCSRHYLGDWVYVLPFSLLIGCAYAQFSSPNEENLTQWVRKQKGYLKQYAKTRKKLNPGNISYLFRETESLQQTLRLGFLLSLFEPFPSEADHLWLLGQKDFSFLSENSHFFQKYLAHYLMGKFMGERICKVLINPEIVFKRSCSNEDILQFLKNQTDSFCKAQPSFYCQKIVNMWAYPDFLKLMKTIAESSLFLEELERFFISLGSEFGLIWLHQYILEPELSRKKQLEEKLLSLPNKALILAGQRAFILVKNLSLPKIIAAYTLASTKGNRLKESIDALVRHSIQRKKTHVFETLLRPVWGK